MNPLLQFVIKSILPMLEAFVIQEGGAAVAWIEAELNTLLGKYGYTATITPASPANPVVPPKS